MVCGPTYESQYGSSTVAILLLVRFILFYQELFGESVARPGIYFQTGSDAKPSGTGLAGWVRVPPLLARADVKIVAVLSVIPLLPREPVGLGDTQLLKFDGI